MHTLPILPIWWGWYIYIYRPYIDFHTIKPTPKQQGVPVPTEEMPLLEGPNGPQEHAPTEKGLGGLCWAEFFGFGRQKWLTLQIECPTLQLRSWFDSSKKFWTSEKLLNNLLPCWFSHHPKWWSKFSWWMMDHFHRRYRAFAVAHQFLQMQDIEDGVGLMDVSKKISAQTRGFCAFFLCRNDTIRFFLGRNW